MIYETQKTKLPNGEELTFIIATKDDGVVLVIPSDPANSDYQQYLMSLDEANTL